MNLSFNKKNSLTCFFILLLTELVRNNGVVQKTLRMCSASLLQSRVQEEQGCSCNPCSKLEQVLPGFSKGLGFSQWLLTVHGLGALELPLASRCIQNIGCCFMGQASTGSARKLQSTIIYSGTIWVFYKQKWKIDWVIRIWCA